MLVVVHAVQDFYLSCCVKLGYVIELAGDSP